MEKINLSKLIQNKIDFILYYGKKIDESNEFEFDDFEEMFNINFDEYIEKLIYQTFGRKKKIKELANMILGGWYENYLDMINDVFINFKIDEILDKTNL